MIREGQRWWMCLATAARRMASGSASGGAVAVGMRPGERAAREQCVARASKREMQKGGMPLSDVVCL